MQPSSTRSLPAADPHPQPQQAERLPRPRAPTGTTSLAVDSDPADRSGGAGDAAHQRGAAAQPQPPGAAAHSGRFQNVAGSRSLPRQPPLPISNLTDATGPNSARSRNPNPGRLLPTPEIGALGANRQQVPAGADRGGSFQSVWGRAPRGRTGLARLLPLLRSELCAGRLGWFASASLLSLRRRGRPRFHSGDRCRAAAAPTRYVLFRGAIPSVDLFNSAARSTCAACRMGFNTSTGTDPS